MIAAILRLIPWLYGLAKNVGRMVPFLGRLGGSVRMGFYSLLYVMAWGGGHAVALAAILAFLGSMGTGLLAFAGTMSAMRSMIPADIKCTMEFMHAFKYMRDIVIAVITILSFRVGIIAYKFGTSTYRNFVMGVLDRFKGRASPITGI